MASIPRCSTECASPLLSSPRKKLEISRSWRQDARPRPGRSGAAIMRCLIYTRVSTGEQGWEIIGVHEDSGFSGRDLDHPAIRRPASS